MSCPKKQRIAIFSDVWKIGRFTYLFKKEKTFFCNPFALRCRHAVHLRFSETLHNARSTYANARAVTRSPPCKYLCCTFHFVPA